MFSFVLYTDENLSMHIEWFGMGSIVVCDQFGAKRKAHPIQKKFLQVVIDELRSGGAKIKPTDPACRIAFKEIAYAILQYPPTGLIWRVAFVEGPKALAESAIEQSKLSVS